MLHLFALHALALDNGLGLTPPMAYSTWNFFTTNTNETVVLQIADALVATGLADLGYKYVNIDAGWGLPVRDNKTKQIVPDHKKFPNGMKHVADELHKRGLKLGLYTDLTDHSCGTEPGSEGHYELDAQTFASWEVDYLKVDFCGPIWSPDELKPLNESCAKGSLMAGGDLHRANVTAADALAWCTARDECAGFTTKAAANDTCAAPTRVLDVYFKTSDARPNGDGAWTRWMKPGAGRVSYAPAPQYAAWSALRDALNATGRPIYFSICPHTKVVNGTRTAKQWDGALAYSPPFEWTTDQRHALANSILVEYANTYDNWYRTNDGKGGIITDIDSMVDMTRLSDSAPGSWNDADMLMVCNYGKGNVFGKGMTLAEYRSHLSVWSILASPLIISADVRTLNTTHPDCLDLMLNPEIVAVNQDIGGHAPRLVRQSTNASEITSTSIVQQVFARPLGAGADPNELAVLILNRAEDPAEVTVDWAELGLPAGQRVAARDVVGRADLGEMVGSLSATVQSHDVAFLRLKRVTLTA